jgi:hypothetical protein
MRKCCGPQIRAPKMRIRDWRGAKVFRKSKTVQVMSSPWGEETGEGVRNSK